MNQGGTYDKDSVRMAVIIPMYNEKENASKCVRAVCDVLRNQFPTGRLYVVNDGSSDGTGLALEALSREESYLKYCEVKQNGGYGAALVVGAREAHNHGFEFGLFMDSDLTNDPGLIPKFAKALENNQFDLIKASRYIEGGGMCGVPLRRRLVTILGNKVASWLFRMGIRDCTNGFRAVRLSLLLGFKFKERGFPMIVEELYHLKKSKARVGELPYVLTARDASQGSSKFSYRFSTFYRYLLYAMKSVFVKV